uniref:Uncharacterized protein n=1 Tax=Anopheles stephensi TaxID=30069 RepID=A0A182YS56_ANOST
MRGGNITKYTICEKAKQIFNDIVKDIVPSTSAGKQPETFQPSNDWFERFKQRTGIHNLIRPAPAVNHHFHIVTCAKLIGKAWAGVTASTLRSAWKKLWKGVEWMECSDAAATSDTAEPTVHELIALGNRLGLAIDSNDIEELLTEYLEDPSIKECSIDMPKVVNKEPVSAEAVVKSNPQSTEDIRNVLNAWDTVSSY